MKTIDVTLELLYIADGIKVVSHLEEFGQFLKKLNIDSILPYSQVMHSTGKWKHSQ